VRYAATTTNNVVSYVAVLSINNEDLALRPGMTATAEIVTAAKKNALLVPNGALRFTPPGVTPPTGDVSVEGAISKFVWILKDGKPVPVGLELGLTNGQKTEIVGGDLAEGTSVLTDIQTKGQ
jgi:HlyD family secretion protein